MECLKCGNHKIDFTSKDNQVINYDSKGQTGREIVEKYNGEWNYKITCSRCGIILKTRKEIYELHARRDN